MSFVIYNSEQKKTVGSHSYETERGAKVAKSRKFKGNENCVVMSYDDYLAIRALTVKKIKVTNLMSGKEVEIDEDTPRCCDPSSELYWCM